MTESMVAPAVVEATIFEQVQLIGKLYDGFDQTLATLKGENGYPAGDIDASAYERYLNIGHTLRFLTTCEVVYPSIVLSSPEIHHT